MAACAVSSARGVSTAAAASRAGGGINRNGRVVGSTQRAAGAGGHGACANSVVRFCNFRTAAPGGGRGRAGKGTRGGQVKAVAAVADAGAAAVAAMGGSAAAAAAQNFLATTTASIVPGSTANLVSQVALELRDDYDPLVIVFCLNAIFLSVVLNALNFGLERDDEGNVSFPEGGVPEVLRRSRDGIVDYFRKPFQQVQYTPELIAAIEELREAKRVAYIGRGTSTAEESAQRFMAARRAAIAAGLPETDVLLSAKQSKPN